MSNKKEKTEEPSCKIAVACSFANGKEIPEKDIPGLEKYLSKWIGAKVEVAEVDTVKFNWQLTEDEDNDCQVNVQKFADAVTDYNVLLVDEKFASHVQWICHRLMENKVLQQNGFFGVLKAMKNPKGEFVRWGQYI